MTSSRPRRARVAAAAGLLGAAALIALMVLTPTPELPSRAVIELSRLLSVLPGVGGGPRTSTAVEAGLNVVLFVPLGAALAWWRPRRGVLWAAGVGFWSSVAVETGQALFLAGRSASAGDVVMNAIGATLGAAAAMVLRRLVVGSTG